MRRSGTFVIYTAFICILSKFVCLDCIGSGVFWEPNLFLGLLTSTLLCYVLFLYLSNEPGFGLQMGSTLQALRLMDIRLLHSNHLQALCEVVLR